jgi:predicted Zn-dependent protease
MTLLRKTALASVLIALALSSVLGSEPKPSRPSYNHFTDDDEAKIGNAFAQKIEKEGVPVSGPDGQEKSAHVTRNVLLEAYLNSLASKLGKASQRADVPYTVRVIDAPGVVNAMSVPGGHIYIYSGLLDFVQNEGELAAVIGHEIGHVVGRHAMNRIARVEVVAALIDQARQNNIINDDTAQKIADLALPILFSVDAHTFYSRDNEIEADLLGFYEMIRAGWDPKSEVELLARLSKVSAHQGGVSAFIATHPDASVRHGIIKKEFEQAQIPSGLAENSLAFKAMKMGLSAGH